MDTEDLTGQTDPGLGESPRLGGDVRKVVRSFVSLGFVSGAALIFNIVLTRLLTLEEFDTVGLVRTFLDLLQVPAAFGMAATIAKHVADRRASDEQRRSMFATGTALCLTASIVATLAAFAYLLWPEALKDPRAVSILRWLIFITPFVTLFACIQGYQQGVGDIRRLTFGQTARSLIRVGVGSALVAIFGFVGWLASVVVVEISAFFLGVTQIGGLRGARANRAYVRPFLQFGGFTAATLGLTSLLSGVDIICLDRFRDVPGEIAHYKIATLMFTTALLLPNAYIQARYSTIVAAGHDAAQTWRIYLRNSGVLLAVVIPASVVGFFMAYLIPYVFGPDYARSIVIFQWLLPAYVIQSVGKLSSNLVAGAGMIRSQFVTSVLTVAANIVLNVWLIPPYGVAGAVIATTASFVLKSLISTIILLRYKANAA